MRGLRRALILVGILAIAVLLLVLLGTYFASQYGPLPTGIPSVAISGIVFFLAAAGLASWADRRATPEELAARKLSPR